MSRHEIGILGPLSVSAVGLGCTGMSGFYGTPDDQESFTTVHAALDVGLPLDTVDLYGSFTNEVLVARPTTCAAPATPTCAASGGGFRPRTCGATSSCSSTSDA